MPDGTVVMRAKTTSIMHVEGLLRKKGRKPVASACLAEAWHVDARPRQQCAGTDLLRDEAGDLETVRRLIRREGGAREKVLIRLPVPLETEWALRRRYGPRKNQIMDTISGLLEATD
jgi:hypothetical protein